MNRLLLLIACCFLFSTCESTKLLEQSSIQKFKLEVLQNGQVYTPEDSPIKLARAAFKLRITLYDTEGIMFSSATTRTYYDISSKADIFACDLNTYEGPCHFVAPKSMAEPKFNPEKTLVIGDENRLNYWFYDEEESWHRFDPDIAQNGSTVIAHRSVSRLYYPEVDRYLDLRDAPRDIFIVAAAQAERTEEDLQTGRAGKELQREKFILRFE